MKITRNADKFIACRSLDGVNWTEFERTSVPMESKVYVGFGVTSHDFYTTCTARFGDVEIR